MESHKDAPITFSLFANPSFAEGYTRLIDLFGTLNNYNESETVDEADYRAIKNDWIAVGEDLKKVMNSYGRTKGTTTRGF